MSMVPLAIWAWTASLMCAQGRLDRSEMSRHWGARDRRPSREEEVRVARASHAVAWSAWIAARVVSMLDCGIGVRRRVRRVRREGQAGVGVGVWFWVWGVGVYVGVGLKVCTIGRKVRGQERVRGTWSEERDVTGIL